MPSLNQTRNLYHYMKDDEMIKMQFDLKSLSDKLYDVTDEQFKRIKYLRNFNKSMALRDYLIGIGVKTNE